MRADQIRHQRRHPARHRQKERGAALVMVLLALVVLTVFLTELQQETSVAFSSAISARERLKAEYNARSGINLGRLLIAARAHPAQQHQGLRAFARRAEGASDPALELRGPAARAVQLR